MGALSEFRKSDTTKDAPHKTHHQPQIRIPRIEDICPEHCEGPAFTSSACSRLRSIGFLGYVAIYVSKSIVSSPNAPCSGTHQAHPNICAAPVDVRKFSAECRRGIASMCGSRGLQPRNLSLESEQGTSFRRHEHNQRHSKSILNQQFFHCNRAHYMV